jgi:hypothetical protein
MHSRHEQGVAVEQFPSYVESVSPRPRRATQLIAHVALLVLLAMSALVAVRADHGTAPKLRLVHPRSGGCAVPYTRSVTDGAGVTTTLQLCISQEGNITSLFYPDTSAGHSQISFDAYCLFDFMSNTYYTDFGGAPGVPPSSGFGPATITQPNGPNTNPVTVTRSTTDANYQVSEYIAVNFVPRSIAVIVSVKNTSSIARSVGYTRAVAPKVDGDASNDQYNEFGIGATMSGSPLGTTGEAFQSPGPGSNKFSISVASKDGTRGPFVRTDPLADWQAGANSLGGCVGGTMRDTPGFVSGGNRVLLATALQSPALLASNATAKLTYDFRMQ